MAALTSSATLSCAVSCQDEATKHTLKPIVTGTSVVAVKFKNGVIMACDTLGSYGSLARYAKTDRIVKVGDFALVGADGDMSDFQEIKKIIQEIEFEDKVGVIIWFTFVSFCLLYVVSIVHG